MKRDVNESDLSVNFANIAPVAACTVAFQYEAMSLDDGNKLTKGAFQAGQGTENPIDESPSRLLSKIP